MTLAHLILFNFFPGAVLGAPAPVAATRRPGYDARAARLIAIKRDDEEILMSVSAAVRKFFQ